MDSERPGYKTSEFWLVTLSWVVAALLSSGLFADGGMAFRVVTFAGAALATMGYSVGRSYVKGREADAKMEANLLSYPLPKPRPKKPKAAKPEAKPE